MLGLLIFASLAWVQRSEADPCFKTAAKKVACVQENQFCIVYNDDKMMCDVTTEKEIRIDFFSCGGVGEETNCNPQVAKDGGPVFALCFKSFHCNYDSETGACQKKMNPFLFQYSSLNQTDKCVD
ncbi:MAG: hypothetical protein HYX68_19435 [Planctomycetes bacterium]|nr:hypothetical protein [Planctomycetota bacterium]